MNWLGFIPARQRITLGLVGLMVGTLLIASAAGFFPNEQREILNGRAKLAETLAISSTAMASSAQFASLQATLDSVVNRDDDVQTIGLRRSNGELLVTAGDHSAHWDSTKENGVHQMRVPVFRKGEHWGNLEICFISTGGFLGLNYWAPAWLLVIMIPACFFQFAFFLRKSLKHLDPSDRVPQHVQDALDTLSVGLVLLNGDHRVLFGNREFSHSVGRSAAELMGSGLSELNWEMVAEGQSADAEHVLPWIEATRNGHTVDDCILHLTVDGERRTFSVNCSKVGQGLMAIFDDITLLEQAREAAMAASESKSAFLANMSHEIRTPLNAVLGFTDVLRRGLVTDTDESVDHLNMIHRSGKHLLELINDILDLSKIEAGKMEVESIDTRVDQILLDTSDVLAVKARDRDLSLNVEFQTPMPRLMKSDPTRLKQIVTNLVGNAIKFTQKGSVTISAGVEALPEGAQAVRIDIVDTGIGMTPEQQQRIFESFAQADQTTTRKFGGTGLGLSISRRLTEALGGSLTVSSQPGHGSTFSVLHPIEDGALDDTITPDQILADRDQAEEMPTDIQRLPSKPVLVVDDGEANRRLIELVLGRAGADVTTAENGLQAIEALSRNDYELILMDMQMPVVDGYTATRKLRAAGVNTPVIALTGNAMKGDRQKCLDCGCSDFLSKPVDIDQLLQRTAFFLGDANRRDSENRLITAKTDSSGSGVPSNLRQRLDAPKPNVTAPIVSTLPMHDEAFRRIVEDFVGKLQERLDEISDAVADANYEEVSETAHWLKGAGGTVGFHDFTAPASA
ncbi:MAG: ATP-binding protein [Planctomycetota bacterium]